jgi:ribose transport system substrate-binding protein
MRCLQLLICVLLLTLAGCTKSKPASTSAALPAGTKDHSSDLYIEVSALGNLDYFYDHKMGMELAGKLLGVKTEYTGPSTYDMAGMANAFEVAITRKPKGIVVVGFEESLTPIIDKAVAQGIPVVTVDADLPDSRRVAFVGTGNFAAGQKGGETLAKLIGGKGTVAILTKTGQSNLEERVAGYKAALATFPSIQIVKIANTESDPIKAAQVAAAVLQSSPDLAGIGCVEAAGGAGAATAVKEAKLAGRVKIVAMDRGNEVLNYIKEGTITASVAQQTALMPIYAVQILKQLNDDPVPITTDNAAAGVAGVPAVVDTGVVIVDKTNYEYFLRK